MHVHDDTRKVRSKTQVRSSSGSSNETHSCRSSGGSSLVMDEPYGATVDTVVMSETRPRTIAGRGRAGPELVGELRAALGAPGVRTGRTELGVYRRDGSHLDGGAASV